VVRKILSRPEGESVVARRHGSGAEFEHLRVQSCAEYFGAPDCSCGFDGGQVLTQQTRLLPFGTNALHPEWLAGHERERQ